MNYLDFWDIKALELIGDRSLYSKIEGCVTQIDYQVFPLDPWPKSAFRYRSLRDLSVYCIESFICPPLIATNDELIPIQGHQTLSKLTIKTMLGFTILRQHSDRPPLKELLPSLEYLSITSIGIFESTMLHHLPSKLGSLHLAITEHNSTHLKQSIPYEQLGYLPKSVHTLKLQKIYIDAPQSLNPFIVQQTLPTGPLTHLDLTFNDMGAFTRALPSTLIDLCLSTSDVTTNNLLVSSLPQSSLTSLSFRAGRSGNIIFDTKFPPSIKLLSFSTSIHYLKTDNSILSPEEFLSSLPSSLQDITGCNTMFRVKDASQLPPFMRRMRTSERRAKNLAFLPPSLHTLNITEFQQTPHFLSLMPITITKLYAHVLNVPLWLETIKSLVNLKSLYLAHPQTCSRAQPLPSLGFWDVVHSRLETLDTTLDFATDFKDIFGPWKKLHTLALTASSSSRCLVFDEEAKRAPLEFYSPPTLTNLLISSEAYFPFLWSPIPHLSSLRHLTLQLDRVPDDNFPQDAWDILGRLPSFLRSLSLRHADATVEQLSRLPKSLKRLAFYYGHLDKEHLEVLPDSLTALTCTSTRRLSSTSTSKLSFTLPRRLVYLVMAQHQLEPSHSEAAKEYFRQRDL